MYLCDSKQSLISVFFAGLLLATSGVAGNAQKNQNSGQPKRADAKSQPGPASGTGASQKGASSVDAAIKVAVRPNCEVNGPAFTLGEIAEIYGRDSALTAQLAAVEIGASPLPGLSRIINPGDITVRLRQHHLESAHVELLLPPGIRITRAGRDVAADEITRAAIESAKDAIKEVPGATLEPVSTGTRLVVPSGKAQIVAGAWRGTLDSGTLTVPVSILVDGKPVQSIDVALKIHRKTMALVARREIQIHDIIGPGDVSLAQVELPAGLGSPVTDLEEAYGKRATRRIHVDAPIGADMLEKAPLIAPNDAVTIEFVYGSLRITASGIARQAGAAGDSVRVFTSDTHKELDGIVVDKHTVRVAEGD